MSKAIASEVIVSAHGLLVVGMRGPRTRLWFRPTGTTRLVEHSMQLQAPVGPPAALMADGRVLLLGRNGEAMVLQAGRSSQPALALKQGGVVWGLSPDLVAVTEGPRFFAFEKGAWVEVGPQAETPPKAVVALSAFAVGEACWAPTSGKWAQVALKTKAKLRCTSGEWAGGEGVVLQRGPKGFRVQKIDGTVSAICPWKKSALMVVDGVLRDLDGTALKAPAQIASVSAFGDSMACIAKGSFFETTDGRRWERRALPK